MSVVIPFGRFARHSSAPPLLLVEMFDYQLDGPVSLAGEQVCGTIANCRMLLEHARAQSWPVGFIVSSSRARRRSHLGLGWIDGFQPQRRDMVFETAGDSCYSSTEFADAITNCGNCFLLAGFSGERVCLATLMDAPHHRHHAALIEDAASIRQMHNLSASESCRALVAVASNYGTILTTSEWLRFGGTRKSELEPCYDRV